MDSVIRAPLLAILFAVGLVAAAPAEPAGVWYENTDGVAIGGYDPVAYFTDGVAAMGDPAIAFDWNGTVWHFASEAHRAAFEADPAHFAPLYGGYCAFAMTSGAAAPTDPEDGWTVFQDRLYLNYSADIRDRWRQDMPGFIVKADRHWPEVSADLAAP
jgi:hypothetical protein